MSTARGLPMRVTLCILDAAVAAAGLRFSGPLPSIKSPGGARSDNPRGDMLARLALARCAASHVTLMGTALAGALLATAALGAAAEAQNVRLGHAIGGVC